MVILKTQNKITDFFMILARASPFKKGDITVIENCRRISLLPALSKVFEFCF